MAVAGVVVALAWLAPRVAEVEVPRLALVTLGAVHSDFTHTCSGAVAAVVEGPEGVAAAGLAAGGAVGEVPVLAVLALRAHVARQAAALARRHVTVIRVLHTLAGTVTQDVLPVLCGGYKWWNSGAFRRP